MNNSLKEYLGINLTKEVKDLCDKNYIQFLFEFLLFLLPVLLLWLGIPKLDKNCLIRFFWT
jgi:hypothetical protein